VRALLGAELLKLRTTRTASWFLVAIVLLTLGANAAEFATIEIRSKDDLEQALSGGAGIASLLLLVLGIVATTGEYRHGTITSSLLASPDRRRFLAAKLLAYMLTGALLGAFAMLVTIALGLPWLSEREVPVEVLGAGDYLELFVRAIAIGALLAGVGVGIGAIVRTQVVALVGTLVYLFVLEPVLALLSSEVTAYLVGGTSASLSGDPGQDALGPLAAGVVLAAWVVLLGVVGGELEERRDVV
jgi:ABC-2 type transport system permease protein